jgi:anaerobic magnesium-protoporphyrin IX monomethyl ester cyclase
MALILLINPSFGYTLDKEYGYSLPIGLLSVGTYLKNNGHDVALIDALTEENYLKRFNEEIKKAKYVGFSVMTQQVPNALKLSKWIKENYPEKIILWGGVHVALFPEQCIKNKNVDYIFPLEGELPLNNLINALEKNQNLKNIKGIGYLKDETIITTERDRFIQLNEIGFIDYSLMKGDIKKIDPIPINTSRGCPFRCAFCINVVTNNRQWRHMDAESVLDYIEYSLKYFNTRHIKFRDELFFFSPERIKAVVDGIIERKLNITWEATCRVNYFNENFVNYEFIKKLKQSGLVKLWFGAESGSQRVLDMLRKDIKVWQIIKSAHMLTNSGIIGNYSFMCGLPGEKKSDMLKTLKIIDKLLKINPDIEIIGPQAYRPYPGGELYNKAIASGWPEPKELGGWEESMKREEYLVAKKYYPWVKNPLFVQSLIIYVLFGAYPFKRAVNEFKLMKTNVPLFIAKMFILLQQIRWKTKFYDFPVDITLANKLLRRG